MLAHIADGLLSHIGFGIVDLLSFLLYFTSDLRYQLLQEFVLFGSVSLQCGKPSLGLLELSSEGSVAPFEIILIDVVAILPWDQVFTSLGLEA